MGEFDFKDSTSDVDDQPSGDDKSDKVPEYGTHKWHKLSVSWGQLDRQDTRRLWKMFKNR